MILLCYIYLFIFVHWFTSWTGHPDAPQNLTISKVIGRRGMLLTWKPPAINEMGQNSGIEIAGYKIFVDGKQKQFVTNANLSKVSFSYMCFVSLFNILLLTQNIIQLLYLLNFFKEFLCILDVLHHLLSENFWKLSHAYH